jgi:hypothetical protein
MATKMLRFGSTFLIDMFGFAAGVRLTENRHEFTQ